MSEEEYKDFLSFIWEKEQAKLKEAEYQEHLLRAEEHEQAQHEMAMEDCEGY